MDTYCSENITELAKALIKVQEQMSPATKDAVNPFIKNKYATLNSVMETCRSALIKNGIWLTQLPVPAPVEFGVDHIGLLTKFTHAESGQWQASLTVVPLPKTDPQGMGSAITYARRYALTSMLGMITEDDDGEAAKITVNTKSSARSASNITGKDNTRISNQKQKSEASIQKDSDLPELEGVTFQFTPTQEGRDCIIATGNTQPHKNILKEWGFFWNPQRKFWWKYADAA